VTANEMVSKRAICISCHETAHPGFTIGAPSPIPDQEVPCDPRRRPAGRATMHHSALSKGL
jgi:hypothetical protein